MSMLFATAFALYAKKHYFKQQSCLASLTTHAQSFMASSLERDMLKSGNPSRMIMFLLYDSNVPTQNESIEFIEMGSILPIV